MLAADLDGSEGHLGLVFAAATRVTTYPFATAGGYVATTFRSSDLVAHMMSKCSHQQSVLVITMFHRLFCNALRRT